MKPSSPFAAGLNLATIVLALAVVLRLTNPTGPEAVNAFSIYTAGAIFLHGFIGIFMGLKTFSLLMLIFNMAFLRPEEVAWLLSWFTGPAIRNEPVATPVTPVHNQSVRAKSYQA